MSCMFCTIEVEPDELLAALGEVLDAIPGCPDDPELTRARGRVANAMRDIKRWRERKRAERHGAELHAIEESDRRDGYARRVHYAQRAG